MSILEQNTTNREQIDDITDKLEFGSNNSKKYDVEAIYDSMGYTTELKDNVPGSYYLVS